MPDTHIQIPNPTVKEGSSFTATVKFRASGAASAPTTAKYRLDCLTTGQRLVDWTSLSVAASIDIPITATNNAIQNQYNTTEKKQLTVASDPDTSTQTRDTMVYKVENIRGF